MYNAATGLEPHRLALVDPVDPAPRVTKVFVSGGSWSATFLDRLQQTGAGETAFGYAISAADQLNELPWTNITQISVRFSEHVNAVWNDLVVNGVNVATYGGSVAASPFSYDPATFTATWRLGQSIPADKVLLDLDGDVGTGVTDAGGNALDGEWPIAPPTAPAFPSGDGNPGGDFRFRFNVLPGDGNRSGATTSSDLIAVRNRQNTTTSSPGAAPNTYDVMFDVNGSGSITSSDLIAVRNLQNAQLPAGEPAMLVTIARGRTSAGLVAAPVASRVELGVLRPVQGFSASGLLDELD
jgi:hypothetical protein